jgi:cation:H+ antiporter
VVGAETLVRGSSRLAVSIGISPLVVGLTVVAFGTSSPELAVSISSALAGESDIAVGNVVGSNIFSVLFILGVSAVLTPLVVLQQLVRLDVPLMIAASALFLVFALDGTISRFEGAVLFAGLVAYIAWAIYASRRDQRALAEAAGLKRVLTVRALALDVVMVVAGLGLLVLGSEWFVNGAVEIAEALGVSQLVIGLTVVAVGTSMPEVATSVMASLRGERDIAVGNVIGSCLFNILAVLGLTSMIAAGGVAVASAALRFDIPVMLAVAVACLPIFFTGRVIARWEGLLFLAYYVAYAVYLFLDATDHGALGPYSVVLIGFLAPITGVTLAVLAFRGLMEQRGMNRRGESPG